MAGRKWVAYSLALIHGLLWAAWWGVLLCGSSGEERIFGQGAGSVCHKILPGGSVLGTGVLGEWGGAPSEPGNGYIYINHIDRRQCGDSQTERACR